MAAGYNDSRKVLNTKATWKTQYHPNIRIHKLSDQNNFEGEESKTASMLQFLLPYNQL